MKQLKKLPLYLFAALFLAALVVFFDISKLYWPLSFNLFSSIRDFIHYLVFVLFLLHLNNLYKERELSISDANNKIVQLFLIILIIYSIAFIINGFNHIEFLGESRNNLDRLSWNIIVGTALLSYSVAYIFIKILFYFKTLVYYKRRRNTALLYRLFFFFSFVFIVCSYFYEDYFQYNIEYLLNNEMTLLTVVNLVLLLNILIISFRNSWVTYLNRRNKYIYLGISTLIFIYLYFILGDTILGSDLENVKSHSFFFYQFIRIMYSFFIIYNSFTLVYLLLHLPTARVFDRKMKEVQALYNLSCAINSEPDFNKLVLMITNMASEVTEANSTWLEIYDENHDKLYIASSKKLSSSEIRSTLLSKEKGMSGDIFNNREAILINELQKNKKFNYLRTWKKDIASIIAVPLLTTKNDILGIIYVTKSYEFGFDPDDVSMLQAFSNQVVIALENTKLIKESIQRERLEQELKIAREVQLKLLPQEIPKFKNFDIDAIAFTANEVGGDYFDFIQKGKQFGIVVADVSGKGTSAAFYMAELKGIIKSLSSVHASPKDLFCHTNEILYEQLEKKAFITGSIFSINTQSKKAKFVRAGHCPLIKYCAKSDEILTFTPNGMGLGICNEKIFNPILEEMTVDFKSGDIVALYTDGLNEARNVFNDEYGDDKIGEIIKENKNADAKHIKDAILDDIIDFTGKAKVHDDMTLAIMKFL